MIQPGGRAFLRGLAAASSVLGLMVGGAEAAPAQAQQSKGQQAQSQQAQSQQAQSQQVPAPQAQMLQSQPPQLQTQQPQPQQTPPQHGHASVMQRIPGPQDAAPMYRQDMIWLDQQGRSWAMRDAGSGGASWLYQEPAARVLDEIGGVRPTAAYGTRRLTASYTGPLVGVIRVGDGASLDVGFLPNDQLDEAALGSFCGRGECRVARWYDQSGNRNDAVQTVPAARPAIRLAHRVGNAVSVMWDYEATSGAPARALVLPRGVAIDSGSMGIMWTGRFHNASMISPLIELGTDAEAFNFGFWDAHGDFYFGTPNELREIPGHAATTASVGVISSSQADGTIVNYRNARTGAGTLKPKPHAGGFIGQSSAYRQNGMMELSSLVLYARPLSPGDMQFGRQALGENFGIAQQQQDVYVADGDSITQGIASPYLQGYPWHIEKLLPASLVVYNAGWAGKTLGGADGLVDRYQKFTAALYNACATNNVISLFAGTNDIQAGANAEQVYREMRSYLALARKTGFRVVIGTILPRATFSASMEAHRVALNGMLRADWAKFADGLADFASDPTLGRAGATSNQDVYAADGIHLTDYGYQVAARVMADAVLPLLR
jgi:lysophospholipase L1-like esterase